MVRQGGPKPVTTEAALKVSRHAPLATPVALDFCIPVSSQEVPHVTPVR